MGSHARRRKAVLAAGGTALAVASPLAFTLGSADLGGMVSGSIIAATAVGALIVPLWPNRPERPEPDAKGDPAWAAAVQTGRAKAVDGGDANSGVRVTGSVRGRLLAMGTGRAIARGKGSHANSGVEIRATGRTDREDGA